MRFSRLMYKVDHLFQFRPDGGMALGILFLTTWFQVHFKSESFHNSLVFTGFSTGVFCERTRWSGDFILVRCSLSPMVCCFAKIVFFPDYAPSVCPSFGNYVQNRLLCHVLSVSCPLLALSDHSPFPHGSLHFSKYASSCKKACLLMVKRSLYFWSNECLIYSQTFV